MDTHSTVYIYDLFTFEEKKKIWFPSLELHTWIPTSMMSSHSITISWKIWFIWDQDHISTYARKQAHMMSVCSIESPYVWWAKNMPDVREHCNFNLNEEFIYSWIFFYLQYNITSIIIFLILILSYLCHSYINADYLKQESYDHFIFMMESSRVAADSWCNCGLWNDWRTTTGSKSSSHSEF